MPLAPACWLALLLPGALPSVLDRAADCVERGEPAAAVPLLRAHLADHPDHLAVRGYLADLLDRMSDPTAAADEYERLAAAASGPAGRRHRVHAHARLMALAADAGDEYGEHLHRGLGLVALAGDGPRPDEALLFQAVGALTLAERARPGDGRAAWHLAAVWGRLGQSVRADGWRRRAAADAAFAPLPVPERQGLHLAAGEAAARRR
jgi:hypothetical protein